MKPLSQISALALTVALAAPVAAQDIETTNATDTIIVTASRTEQKVWTTGEAVSVVDRQEIEDSQAVSANELLERVPGVVVSRSGGLGQPSSAFVRGADNAQSLILVDGVRINDPADVGGGFDFGSMLAGSFDRVEIVRGSKSVIWGSQAIGGVVNFLTPEPGSEWTGRASAEYGARDRVELTGAAGGSVGPVGLSVGADWLDTDGYSAFSEKRGGREKDGFEGVSAFAKAEINLTDALSLNAGGFYSDNYYEFDANGADAPNYGEKRDLTGFAFA